MSLRSGITATDENEGIEQYTLGFLREIELPSLLPLIWDISLLMDISAGAILTERETGFIGSIGPILAINYLEKAAAIEFGVSPTYLSNDDLEEQNFGGQLQFISHVGVSVRVFKNYRLGYRIQHMSNGSIKKPNPGLNLHIFKIDYEF